MSIGGPEYAATDIRCHKCLVVRPEGDFAVGYGRERRRARTCSSCLAKVKVKLLATRARTRLKLKREREREQRRRRLKKRRLARVVLAKPRTVMQRAEAIGAEATAVADADEPPVRSKKPMTVQRLAQGKGGFATFAAFFWKVRDKDGDLVRFVLNSSQRIVLAKIERQMAAAKPVRIRILKFRQVGMSIFASLFALWWTLTHAGHNVISIANRIDLPKKWVARLRLLVAQINTVLPDGTGPRLKTESEMGVSFADFDSSYMIGSSEGRTVGMGDVLQGLHLSEVPYWVNPDETMDELIPAVPFKRNTFIIVESTGLSVGDSWYKAFYEAKNGVDDHGVASAYDYVFLPWFLAEEYQLHGVSRSSLEPLNEDELSLIEIAKEFAASDDGRLAGFKGITAGHLAWRRAILHSEFRGDKEIFANKFPATEEEAFLAGGANIFKKPLPELARKTQRKPKYTASIFTEMGKPDLVRHDWSEPHGQFRYVIVKDEAGDVKIWDEPDENYHYVLGADCQWGDRAKKLDYDVLHVECLETGRLVASMRGRYDLYKWGRNIAAMGYYYNTCVIAPERNGKAAQVMMPLLIGNIINWRYPNIWIRSQDWKLRGVRVEDYGWYTGEHSKGDLVQYAMTTTLTGDFDWCDEQSVFELMAYIRNSKGEMTAPDGMNDDALMSRMITAYVAHVERPGTDLYVEKQPQVYSPTTPAQTLEMLMAEDDEIEELTPQEEREKILEKIYGPPVESDMVIR